MSRYQEQKPINKNIHVKLAHFKRVAFVGVIINTNKVFFC